MKLYIIVGTRPEIIRLSETIKLSKKLFDTTLIHTGQNYDYNLNEIFFDELELPKPDIYLDCSRENSCSAVGDIISKSYNLFQENKPDCILILGDTNSSLCSYSAKRLKIPIFHIEAGNRCFDPNVPEELNRKIVDHLSDVNMCYMEHARRNLLKEGIESKYVFVIGSPMTEILYNLRDKIDENNILEILNIKEKEYFLLSTHREENIELNFDKIVDCIYSLDKEYNKKIVFTVHPRTKKKIEEKNIKFSDNVILHKPFGIIDYLNLQRRSLCVISDSGTVTEEASILKFPAVLLRTSTEHPEGIDSGNIIMGNIDSNSLLRSIKIVIMNKNYNIVQEYVDINTSEKVCNIISGYVGVVNKYVWMK